MQQCRLSTGYRNKRRMEKGDLLSVSFGITSSFSAVSASLLLLNLKSRDRFVFSPSSLILKMTFSLIDPVAQCCFSFRMHAWVISAICRVLTFLLIVSLGGYATFTIGPLIAAVENLSRDPVDANTVREFAVATDGGGMLHRIERGEFVMVDWQGKATNAMHITLTPSEVEPSPPPVVLQSMASQCNASATVRQSRSGGWVMAACLQRSDSQCVMLVLDFTTGAVLLQRSAPQSLAASLCGESLDWANALDVPASVSLHDAATVVVPVVVAPCSRTRATCPGVLNVSLVTDDDFVLLELLLTVTAVSSLSARSVFLTSVMPSGGNEHLLVIAVDVGENTIALLTMQLTGNGASYPVRNATFVSAIAVSSAVRLLGVGSSESDGRTSLVTLLLWEGFAVGAAAAGDDVLAPQHFVHTVRMDDGVVSDAVMLPMLDERGERWIRLNASVVGGTIDASCMTMTPRLQLTVRPHCNMAFGTSLFNTTWVGGVRFVGIASTSTLTDGFVGVVVAGSAAVLPAYGVMTPGRSYGVGPHSRSLVALRGSASFQMLGFGIRRSGMSIGPHTLLLAQ